MSLRTFSQECVSRKPFGTVLKDVDARSSVQFSKKKKVSVQLPCVNFFKP